MGKSWKDSNQKNEWGSNQKKNKGKKPKSKQRDYATKYKNYFLES